MKTKEIARQTIRTIEQGSYLNNLGESVSIREATDAAVANTILYRDEDFPSSFDLVKQFEKTTFELTDETTLEAAKRVCTDDVNVDPYVLNFASAKNPGGGFLSGAKAQEESIARSSSLYPCLSANFAMYEYNRGRKSCLYSDWMIYSPRVPVFKNDDGSLVRTPYLASIITSPAVNAGVVREKEPTNVGRIDAVNRERARKFLWIANKKSHATLILGAWGCGVFRNDPLAIASIFRELLEGEFERCFERVVFAVYDRTKNREVLSAFAEVFSGV